MTHLSDPRPFLRPDEMGRSNYSSACNLICSGCGDRVKFLRSHEWQQMLCTRCWWKAQA